MRIGFTNTTTYSYDAMGNRQTMQLGSASPVKYAYNDLDQLTVLTDTKVWSASTAISGAAINWQFTCEKARLILHHLYPKLTSLTGLSNERSEECPKILRYAHTP